MQNAPQPSRLTIWVQACRPKTLPAAAAPVILAGAIAFYELVFSWQITLAALGAALCLQVGANLANDVYDYYRGADNETRLGPVRVTQAGMLSPRAVLVGMWVAFGLAGLLGLVLILNAGWPILLIGLFAILAAIAYSGGPIPYGYLGLGDLFVFLFFGFAAVCGTYYAQALTISRLAIWGSISMGSLSTAILVVNNLRDIETDRAAGKVTLAVRFGRKFALAEYGFLMFLAYVVPIVLVAFLNVTPWILLSLLSLYWLPGLFKTLQRSVGRPLNAALAGTGQLELWFAIGFSIGLILGG
ncbi:MAG: 1,4-dihydroxy-2-naphthoate polyprenyltransferase [Anaerolineales bacterium]|jgi:1,4-dihydroxy-2-naphthoate octaprenyltransferase